MCAAPGSKTAQLMEMVSAPTAGVNPAGDKSDGEVGLVVANDSDRDRAYMLAHQCKRVKSPAICITWCSAQLLPNLGTAGAEKGSDKGNFFVIFLFFWLAARVCSVVGGGGVDLVVVLIWWWWWWWCCYVGVAGAGSGVVVVVVVLLLDA